MLSLRSNPSFIFLFIFFFISFHHGSSTIHSLQPTSHIPEIVNARGYNGVAGLNLNIRRSVAETEYNSSLILAERRTHRRDPSNNIKYYDGGYNISSDHYWASVAFTAVPMFVIAAIWFVIFGLCLSLACLCFCCCRKEPYGYSRTCYALSLIFLVLFTIAAIVGCVVLYTGQGKFHNKTSDTLNYVVDQADDIFTNLRNVSDYLSAAKQIGVDSFFLPKDVVDNIGNVQTKLNSSMNKLSDRTGDNSKKNQHFLDGVGLALIIIAAVMLSLTFLGFLFSIFGLPCLVHTLVVLGWILVAGTFVLCGVFLLLHNVVADTCVAMDEWVENPTAHTALDDILPCVDNATAQETLDKTQDVAYHLVNVVNAVITNISNVNYPPNLGPPLYFNQSGPLVPLLCNPLNPDHTARQCATGEVDFTNATQVWKDYICEVSSSKTCTTPGRVTLDIYNQMTASANVSYGLYHYSPFLVNLVDCTFVRETFTDISSTYCPGLRRYSQWVYIGLVMVSGAVMLSLIFWVIYARERRHRVYTKQFMDRPSEGPFGRNKGP